MAEDQKITPQDHAASIALELYLSAINALRLAAVTVSPYRSRLQVPGGAASPCDAVLAVASQALPDPPASAMHFFMKLVLAAPANFFSAAFASQSSAA